MRISGIRSVGGAGSCPSVRVRIIPAACIKKGAEAIPASPNNHFITSPYSAVVNSRSWRVGSACGYPAIRDRIVSSAGVRAGESASPNDHLGTRPHCCMRISGAGSICGTNSYPSICTWVVSPASVHAKGAAAPDDHLGTGPYRCVVVARVRWTGGGCPCAIDATASAFRCLWEPVVIHWDCDCITYLGFSSS